MSYYKLLFSEKAKQQYDKIDKSIKSKVDKKLIQIQDKDKIRRHLKFGEPYYVDEVGQYRIVYEINANEITILVLFIGKHKTYEGFLKRVREELESYQQVS